MGRPSVRTPELCRSICERIAEGELITAICGEPGMPSRGTVWRWTTEDATFRDDLARATAIATQSMADELLQLVRTPSADQVQASDKRTAAENLRWLLGRRLPKDYGDRQHIEHSGAIADGLTDEQRAKRMAEILRAARSRKSPTGATQQSGEVAARISKMPKNPKP